MIRTSIGIVSVDPTGRTTRSCERTQQLRLQRQGHVADLVQEKCPAAGSLEQSLVRTDGARNAPLAWPNNSDSSRCSGIAAQFMARKGPETRGLASWMARAINSLPVPESPVTITLASEDATSCA